METEKIMGEIKHAIQRTTSVVSVLVVIFLIGLGLYMGYITFVKPHFNPLPTTTQRGERDNYNLTIAPKQTFFGCMRFNIPKPEELKK